ncbi:unnamed protein product [Discula destructiva]
MASTAIAKGATSAARGGAPFTVGGKKLYLPNHVVTFLRPKPGQSPTTATFEVPLTFNKFDFRDYLYHLYNVETTSVRSFINQRMPAQRSVSSDVGGQWYRPRAQKLMIVDLVKPFTWPTRPAAPDMDAWDHKLFMAVEKGHEHEVGLAEARGSWGPQKLRSDAKIPREQRELRRQASALLAGDKIWAPGLEELVEVKKEKSVRPARKEEDHWALAAAARAAEAEAAAAQEARAVSESAKKSAKGIKKGSTAEIEKLGRKP